MPQIEAVAGSHLNPNELSDFAGAIGDLSKVQPSAMDWHRFRHDTFCAEFAVKGDDIVYHFFPSEMHQSFADPTRFAKKVETAFKSVFPPNADIRADFVQGRVVEKVKQSNGDTDHVAIEIAPMGEDRPPQDTWHITAVGWGTRPGAISFAGNRLMQRIVQEMMLVGS